MEPIQGFETSAFNNNQTPGKYPQELLSSLQHGESLKHRIETIFLKEKSVAGRYLINALILRCLAIPAATYKYLVRT